MIVKTVALVAGVSLAAACVAAADATAAESRAGMGGMKLTARAASSQPARSEVPLTMRGTALMVRGTINGGATFTFELDTGAGIVVLPRSVAAKLVTAADYLGMRTYVFGDGRLHAEPTYRLHSVTVGGLTATEVTCALGDEENTFLLGRSFFQQFKSWSIDNNRRVLVLES
jgi:predicted aspartyl protease